VADSTGGRRVPSGRRLAGIIGGRLRDQIGMQRLREITAGSWKPLPKDHGRLSELDSSYSYLRQFTPNVLAAIDFRAARAPRS
jgi:hypothetical protein